MKRLHPSAKIAYYGAWIRIANMRNKYWRAKDPHCVGCGRLAAGTVWYNFYTDEVRCMRCIKPVADAYWKPRLEKSDNEWFKDLLS